MIRVKTIEVEFTTNQPTVFAQKIDRDGNPTGSYFHYVAETLRAEVGPTGKVDRFVGTGPRLFNMHSDKPTYSTTAMEFAIQSGGDRYPTPIAEARLMLRRAALTAQQRAESGAR